MRSLNRVRAAVLATLAIGAIATVVVTGPAPAHAQVLEISSLDIMLTNGPHVITIHDDGVPCTITIPVTNCEVVLEFSSQVIPYFSGTLLVAATLYTLDVHFAVSSMSLHIALEDFAPNCLFVMTTAKLFNLSRLESFLFLGTIGSYTMPNCPPIITAIYALAFGSSPSAAHVHLALTTAHT